MTISGTYTPDAYTGNGSTTAFPVTFVFFGTSTNAEIEVIERVVATGVESTKVNGTDYTVTGGSGATGTVTAATAPASTVQWIIRRVTTETQETDYVENDPFPAESHEAALDRLTLVAQEATESLTRAIQFPVSYTGGASNSFPEPSASTVIAWNAAANALESGPTTTDITNAESNATAAAASATLASQWATKTDGQVASTDYSSKAWAIGGTGVTDTASAGAAKEWATAAEDDLVDGSEYSAKHYSAKASGFATNAETSATNAAASEAAAAAAAQGWADVVSITAGTTNIEITDANKYYILDASGGSITMNLPAVGTSDGLTLAFEVLDASNAITIARDGTDTINGSAADYTSLTGVGDVVHFISIDGTPDNWSARLISRFVVDGTSITQSGRTISVNTANDQAWTGSQRGTPTTDNDGSFDMNAANNFNWTPAGADTIEFTNETAGQGGLIYLANPSAYAITKGSEVLCDANFLATVSAAGNYLISYYSPDGTNVVVANTLAVSA